MKTNIFSLESAFTLAEVLVTVGIIGVVAALTVPNIMDNYQKEAQATQLRKVVNDFSNSVDMLITEEGKTKLAHTSLYTSEDVDAFIKSKFKVIKECEANASSGCFATQDYRAINGAASKTYNCSGKSYVLANSAAVCVSVEGKLPTVSKAEATEGVVTSPLLPGGATSTPSVDLDIDPGDPRIMIQVDTNGTEKPNIGGRDMFIFYVDNNANAQATMNTGAISFDKSCMTSVCAPGATDCTPKEPGPECTTCLGKPFGDGCLKLLIDNNWKMTY